MSGEGSKENIYCLKCKTYTKNIGGETKSGKRGCKYYQTKCGECGSKKSKMISGPTQPKK